MQVFSNESRLTWVWEELVVYFLFDFKLNEKNDVIFFIYLLLLF